MSIPIRKSELEARDYDLHIKAGLVYAGIDKHGETNWIGTEKQWSRYEELKEAEPEEGMPF